MLSHNGGGTPARTQMTETVKEMFVVSAVFPSKDVVRLAKSLEMIVL